MLFCVATIAHAHAIVKKMELMAKKEKRAERERAEMMERGREATKTSTSFQKLGKS